MHRELISIASVAFEKRIPYGLRCRAVLMALPSIYLDAETAIAESPEVTRKDLTKTLQVSQDRSSAELTRSNSPWP